MFSANSVGEQCQRGQIKHIARKQQINDFSGLQFGKITPTDIDCMIEYKGRAYAILEIKYAEADMPFGQRLAIQRLVEDTFNAGKKAVGMVVEHYIHDTNQSVPVAECSVREVYLNDERRWRKPNQNKNTRELLESFFAYVDGV